MMDEKELDQIFATARESRPTPSADLMARVLADAFDTQPAPTAPTLQSAPSQNSVLQSLLGLVQALGGKGGLAGLCTAAIAGVWIGYSGTSGLDWLTNAFLANGSSDVEMIAADDLFLNEG